MHLNSWYNTIETAIKNHIPTKATNTKHKPITSALLKQLQYRFEQIKQVSLVSGWNKIHYNRFNIIQTLMQYKCKKISNYNWQQTIEITATKYKDPKDFWKQIKRLSGNNTTQQHLKVDNEKVTENQEIERII